jgi:menaquinone-dependent protoporphyrinogen oxidase
MMTKAPKVLVTYASKMVGTKGIADSIGAELAVAGLNVTVGDAADVNSVDGYDAVVLGSAIYTSHWRHDAVNVLKLVAARADELRPVPTWLFHSGPCGDQADGQVPAPKMVAKLAHLIGAAAPVTFGGRLQPETAQGFLARKMATGPMAGDFRDFDRVHRFAAGIAEHLTAPKPAVNRW